MSLNRKKKEKRVAKESRAQACRKITQFNEKSDENLNILIREYIEKAGENR